MVLFTGDAKDFKAARRQVHADRKALTELRKQGKLSIADWVWFVNATIHHLQTDSERLRELLGMPAKGREQSSWVGFVDIKLTNEEKEQFSAWDVNDEDLWIIFEDVIRTGHKVAVTYNKQNDNFVASFTGLEANKTNAGYTLSAFAPNWYAAVRVLVFKHSMILEGDFGNAKGRKSDEIG